jgi:putative ABC transport system permease protein
MTVIGVLPPDFRLYLPAAASFPGSIDLWAAQMADLSVGTRDQQWLTVIGRMKPGVSVKRAQSQMDGIAAELRSENQFHENVGMAIDVLPMREDVVGHAEPILLALLGAVGFVLLIACANVANLLLVRGRVRAREVAIRSALGGSRRRIMQGLLMESGLYAVLGGVVGTLLGVAGVKLLLYLRPQNLPRVEAIRIDLIVIGFVFALAMLSALLFGALPAQQSSKADLSETLKQRTQRGGAGVGRGRMRGGLVVAEVGLSLILLIGSGLMLRSFFELAAVRPGFDPQRVLTVNVSLPFYGYGSPPERAEVHLRLRERLEALPGVEAVGAVTPLPLAGGGQFWFGPYAVHESNEEEWSRNEGDYRPILPGYFRSVGTRLLAGRSIEPADLRVEARPVVVVDEKMAQAGWPDERAVGRRLLVMRPSPEGDWDRYWAEVVGVVEHVRYGEIGADGRETIYFPYTDWSWTDMTYTIRAAGDPAALAGAVRSAIRDVGPNIPVATPRPLSEYVAEALAPTRFVLVVMTVFAAIALVLSAVGLYGVIAYSVRERVHEIGVRVVLGAERGQVLRLVLGQGLLLTGLGIAVGVAGSLVVTRAIANLLFGVTPTDPVTFVGISLVLGLVAALACLVPALRATRVDPMVALRAE